jgi:hypothetical protein
MSKMTTLFHSKDTEGGIQKHVFLQSLQKNVGACCNRAIMVITDGMPDIYKDIFDKYNWKADMRVRMFTYLIGDEQPEAYEMKSIACNNNGEK